jgi:coatomer subunit beta'
VVQLWRDDLRKINPKAAEALADPSQYANLFPNMAEALQAEELQVGTRACSP